MEELIPAGRQPGSHDPLPHPDVPKKRRMPFAAVWLGAVIVLAVIGELAYVMTVGHGGKVDETTLRPPASAMPAKAAGLALVGGKAYGDKYAAGLLPVGDGKYTTDGAKAGYVYACSQYAQNLKSDSGGAQARGPWFVLNNTRYDITKKVHVQGAVSWKGSFAQAVTGGTRTITTNDLPGDHTTGVFPIEASDPAYSYDRNPNSIKAQTDSYSLTAAPAYGEPQCMGGQAGIMLTGVPLFSAFDAGGRDAGAWEVQDGCSGHPQVSGEYHYHTLSSCIKDVGVGTVIGFALDGFAITGPDVGPGNVLTTSDLDECHGIVSPITVDGKKVTAYHYVMTQDFPYSVSCFRAKPFSVTPRGGTPGSPSGLQPGPPIGPPPPLPPQH